MKSLIKFLGICIVSLVLLFTLIFGVTYKFCLPMIVENKNVINFVQNQGKKILGADINIVEPKLKTGSDISFNVKKITIDKNKKNLLTLSDIEILLSMKEFYKKRIIVKKMLAKDIYVEAYELSKLVPEQKDKKGKKESPIFFDFYNALLGVKHCNVEYLSPDINVSFFTKHIIFDRTNERKFLHLDFIFFMEKDGHKIEVSANDQNRIFMENKTAYIKDFPIEIDKSKIIINALMTNKGKYELNVNGKNFNASDIANIVRSNIFIANGGQMLEPVKDILGSVDFDLKLTNKTTDGHIIIKNVEFKVIPLLDMPVKITSGNVIIGNNDIEFKGFDGYYNNKITNKLKLKGSTQDYTKTCDTKLLADVFVTNDFFKNYLSKMLGSPVELVGDSNSKLVIKSKNGSLDILWFFLLKENYGFKFGSQSMVLKDYKTFFKVDLSVISNILKINTINYYISNEIKRGMTPLIQIDGNLDMADNMKILNLNLNMPNPLPSEFLNFIACREIFKKGTVSGKMSIDNHNAYPTMNGEFKLDKVLLPSQRMYVRSANLTADGNKIKLKSEGRFKRASYIFDGYILNELRLPIIVKDVSLTVDNIDLERILNQQVNTDNSNNVKIETASDIEDASMPDFQKGWIIIEKCGLNLIKGIYKDINFGNIHADMTLDKDGALKLKSNRFDIAEGTSSLRVNADLVNKLYDLKLGVMNVNSDTMASSILGLPNQISGKAKGFLELNTDKSLKLNGRIKFKINDGTIGQVGYVEYILKVASLFRNPLAMISPSIVIDLVNIPEGRFDDISGEMDLKDNIIRHMNIKSTADELATYITGRYNLETNDASLRIYTKFSNKGKGVAGFLRNISLNSLASQLPITSRNDSNYYASELSQIPVLKSGEERAQVYLTKVDGDIINYNFLSLLKRVK